MRNAFVVSVDPSIGDVAGGDLLIEDGKIAAIGVGLAASDAEIIDATDCIAIPGFVDAHRHLWEGALRAVAADWSILDFVGNMRLLAAPFFRPRDMYATSHLGGLEALNAGVTTVAEYCHNARSYNHALQSIAGVRDAGVRTLWCYSFTKLGAADGAGGDAGEELASVERLGSDAFTPGSLLRFGICPLEPIHWTASSLEVREQFALARRLRARIFMHANSVRKFDGGLPGEVDRLHALGCLGPDLALVHMGYTADREWDLLADTGGHVIFTPEVEMQMGLGWPAVGAARRRGINIGVGADITANNSADMFTQLRSLLQIERGRHMGAVGRQFQTRTPLDCREALAWGTIGGAAACGMADIIGSLTPGKQADIVLFRTDSVSLAGWDRRNPAATIVMQAGVQDIDTVIVGGEVVKRSGRLIADARRAVRALEETSAYVHDCVASAGGFDATQETLYRRLEVRADGNGILRPSA